MLSTTPNSRMARCRSRPACRHADSMESGRFKVFKHLIDWFDEYRLYHRKDGRVHKEGDDLMSATRYAIDDASLRAHGHSTQAPLDQA